MVQGIRATFLLSGIAVVISAVLGTALGMAAGYFGRATDIVVARSADILFAWPALLVLAAMGPGQFPAVSAIAIATLPLLIRVVRSVTQGVAGTGRGFVTASRVAGAS